MYRYVYVMQQEDGAIIDWVTSTSNFRSPRSMYVEITGNGDEPPQHCVFRKLRLSTDEAELLSKAAIDNDTTLLFKSADVRLFLAIGHRLANAPKVHPPRKSAS